MNERLIEELLRLCELEKQSQEDVIAHLQNEISENTLECDQLGNEVQGLRDLLSEELKTSARLRDEAFQVGKWVHIRDWHFTGQKNLMVGVFLDGTAALMERIGSQWHMRGIAAGPKPCGPPLYIYELPTDPIRQKPVGADPQQDEWKGELG